MLLIYVNWPAKIIHIKIIPLKNKIVVQIQLKCDYFIIL